MPKGLRTLSLSFSERNLTHLGGMVLIQRFCSKLKLRWLIQNHVRFQRRQADYAPVDLILALMYCIMAGLRRINKTEILQYNGAFLSLLGISRFPDQSTLRRFLRQFPPKAIRQLVLLHDHLRAKLFPFPQARSTLTFDLDSVVLTVYGKLQFARVGYNPKKHGRRSYHPLLCFESHHQEFWHGSLRPGDAGASTGAVPFLKVCLAKAPKHIGRSRIRVRGDSGFFGKRTIEFLDSIGCGYTIVAREYRPIKTRARECRFKRIGNGWECGEFRYQPLKWDAAHRFVVTRRPIPADPVEAQQLTLFKDKRYAYHVVVTNMKTHPWRVWRFYSKRAMIEKNIRELLSDYALGKIPTEDWIANVAFFQLLLFAFNVVHWFKRLCLPPAYLHTTLDTIRSDFLVLPAKLTKKASRNILVLPHDYHHQAEFRWALRAVDTLKLP